MKHTLNILIFLTLAGIVSAQPGGGPRPGGDRPGGERPGGGESRSVMPISLRIGLIETLGRIGGVDAEAILVKTLRQTSVGVEVSLIDRQLTKLADGAEHQYKDKVLSAAKYILRNPPDAANEVPGQLDSRAVGALWEILTRYKDTTFKEDAERMLITEKGLDRRALDYLTRVLEAQSVPILATAYYDANIEDRTKDELWGRINDYLDESPAAGTVMVDRFKDGLLKMATEAAEKAKRDAERAAGNTEGGGGRGGVDWRSMMGGRGGGGARGTLVRDLTRLGEGKDLTAEAISNRRGILTSVKATTSDANFQTMFVSMEKRLDELANPTEKTSSRFRISDPQEAARREEMRQRLEGLRNRGGGGQPTPRTPGAGR